MSSSSVHPIFDHEVARLKRSVDRQHVSQYDPARPHVLPHNQTDPRTLAEVKSAVPPGCNPFEAIGRVTEVIRERELSARGNLDRLFRPEATL